MNALYSRYRLFKNRLISLRWSMLGNLAVFLLMVMITAAANPQDVLAQRGSTRKGKIERTGSKAGKSKAKKSNSRSAGRSPRARSSSSSRSSQARGSGTGSSRAKSSNGRNSNARGVSSASRNDRVIIPGRRSRLSLPSARAKYRYRSSDSHRYRTHLYYRPAHVHYSRSHSHINVHIAWPWQLRYHRHWSPRYRYRQVVYVRADWGRSKRVSRIEMETTYRHKVLHATDEYAVLDIEIEEIALYDDGRYLGSVDQIPASLSQIEATVFRNGDVAFDRDVFLVGDAKAGFEIISTEFSDGYALSSYEEWQDVRVGRVDFYQSRVRSRKRSRLFDPHNFKGYAPISLLPEEEGWLWDYGVSAISAYSDDYGDYYGYSSQGGIGYKTAPPVEASSDYHYSTSFGAEFSINKTSQIQRIE